MADGPDHGDTQWTSERFDAWLERTAEKEGRSKQEVLHRMMASFWVLTEFEDLVEPGQNPADDMDLRDALEDAPWTTSSDTQNSSPWNEPQQENAHSSPDASDQHSVQDLVEGFASYLDQQTPEPPTDPQSTPAHTQPNQRPTNSAGSRTPTTAPDHIRDRIDDLEDSTANVEDRQADLEDTVEDLAELHEDLEDAVQNLTAQYEELAADHESLADRVDSDMNTVEQILKHLTDRYQNVDDTLGDVEATLTSLLEDRRRTDQTDNRLARVLQSAHTHGVETGKCQDCDSTIKLPLLTSPRCPHCSTPIVDIRPGGWFRANTVITTDDRPPTRDRHQQRDPIRDYEPQTDNESDDLKDVLEAADESDSESFEWTDW